MGDRKGIPCAQMRAAAFKRSEPDAGLGMDLKPEPLHSNRCAVSAALITVLSTRVQEREMEDSRRILCGFCLPGVENSGFRNRSLEQNPEMIHHC